MTSSQVFFSETLPTEQELRAVLGDKRIVVLYDQELLRIPQVAEWLGGFQYGASVWAGEALKKIENFPGVVNRVLPLTEGFGPDHLCILSVGGGSVGDFAGFLASVFKRGVEHVMAPSTWLAAYDSAHGGKTALNVGRHKNQIGTFWPARAVWVVHSILNSQPENLQRSAYGELAKTAFLAGGPLYKELCEHIEVGGLLQEDLLWKLLPMAVEHKYEVVESDPQEKKGLRQILNLGHTLGHALELHHELPHGKAVLLGLRFAVEWSHNLNLLQEKDVHIMRKVLDLDEDCRAIGDYTVNAGRLREALLRDKKITSGQELRFILLEGPGLPLVRKVHVDDVMAEARRQGWTR